MFFFNPDQYEPHDLAPGIHTRTFWGDKMLCSLVELDAGSILPRHSHPHEQAGIILEGQLELTVEGETRLLQRHEIFIIPGGVEHSARVGEEPALVLDIFSPVREEYKFA